MRVTAVYQLHVDEVPPGWHLAVPAEIGGRLVLREGSVLTARRLRRLSALGFQTVYVTPDWPAEHAGKPGAAGPARPDVMAPATRRAALRILRGQLGRLAGGMELEVPKIWRAVHRIVRDVLSRSEVLLQLAEMRSLSDDLFAHQVQVAAISVLCGIHYGFTYQGLCSLAAGALLHDVGKVLLPTRAWMERRQLTPEEFRQVQQHAQLGFELLRRVPGLDVRVAHVAYQHHERWDGTGYPRGLRGAAIHPFARIVAVADVFDALTTDRPHRPAWQWHEAIRFVGEQAGRAFEPRAARVFLGRVAPYPVGMWVQLSTGERAVVVRQNPRFPARPVVRLEGSNGQSAWAFRPGQAAGKFEHALVTVAHGPSGQEEGGSVPKEIDLSQELAVRILGPAVPAEGFSQGLFGILGSGA